MAEPRKSAWLHAAIVILVLLGMIAIEVGLWFYLLDQSGPWGVWLGAFLLGLALFLSWFSRESQMKQ